MHDVSMIVYGELKHGYLVLLQGMIVYRLDVPAHPSGLDDYIPVNRKSTWHGDGRSAYG